ncbi:LuxR family transcriptional regulator [Tsukamurella sp. NPDC003166]|uniref:helix-turn-helix transcriptional regulator n=1 Tax=Tsukamurella sp. NPDC003166 TaxID=3154444 RepID=UPI0033B9260D
MTVQAYARPARARAVSGRPVGVEPIRPAVRTGQPNHGLAAALCAVSHARALGHTTELLQAAAAAARQTTGTAWCAIVPVGAGAHDAVVLGPAGPVRLEAADDSVQSVVTAIRGGAELGYPVVSGAEYLGRVWCGPHGARRYGDEPVFRGIVDQVALVLDADTGGGDATLSNREAEVLRSLAGGLSNEQVAQRLFISAGTVKFHVRNVMHKLGARNRAEAVYLGARRRII